MICFHVLLVLLAAVLIPCPSINCAYHKLPTDHLSTTEEVSDPKDTTLNLTTARRSPELMLSDCVDEARKHEFKCGTANFGCLCFAYTNLAKCFDPEIYPAQYTHHERYSQQYCAKALTKRSSPTSANHSDDSSKPTGGPRPHYD